MQDRGALRASTSGPQRPLSMSVPYGPEADVVRGAGVHGREHPLALGRDLVPLPLRGAVEGLDDQGVVLELPQSGHEAVGEQDAVGLVLLPGAALVRGRDDAGTVGVGEEQVVELGQEARRGRGVRAGARRVGEVEEFVPPGSRKVTRRGRSRSKASRSRVRPAQVCMSFTDAGPNAAR